MAEDEEDSSAKKESQSPDSKAKKNERDDSANRASQRSQKTHGSQNKAGNMNDNQAFPYGEEEEGDAPGMPAEEKQQFLDDLYMDINEDEQNGGEKEEVWSDKVGDEIG